MDSAQWPQVPVKSTEDEEEGKKEGMERREKRRKDEILRCPRCNSNNTKFCYYNNYSLTQPRYFCKSCRRYWTAGGTLRNIPVGGASRKNKIRPSSPNNIFSSPKSNQEYQIKNPIVSSSCCWLQSDHHHQHHQRELIPFMPMPAAAPQQATMCPAAPDHHHQCNSSRNMNNNNNNNNEGLFGSSEEDGDQAAGRLMFGTSSVEEDFKQIPTIVSSADQNGGKLGDVPSFWNGIFGGTSWS